MSNQLPLLFATEGTVRNYRRSNRFTNRYNQRFYKDSSLDKARRMATSIGDLEYSEEILHSQVRYILENRKKLRSKISETARFSRKLRRLEKGRTVETDKFIKCAVTIQKHARGMLVRRAVKDKIACLLYTSDAADE